MHDVVQGDVFVQKKKFGKWSKSFAQLEDGVLTISPYDSSGTIVSTKQQVIRTHNNLQEYCCTKTNLTIHCMFSDIIALGDMHFIYCGA